MIDHQDISHRETGAILMALSQLHSAGIDLTTCYKIVRESLCTNIATQKLIDAILQDSETNMPIRFTKQFQDMASRGSVFADTAKVLYAGELMSMFDGSFGNAAILVLLSQKKELSSQDVAFLSRLYHECEETGQLAPDGWLVRHSEFKTESTVEGSDRDAQRAWFSAYEMETSPHFKNHMPFIWEFMSEGLLSGRDTVIPEAIKWDTYISCWDMIAKE